MKKYRIDWETCYCDDYPEEQGTTIIEAETPEEARKKFYETDKMFAVVLKITERSI